MSDRQARTLLRPDAAEWAALNEEKRRLLTPVPGTPVEDLLRRGQQLSEQAVLLLEAIERANGRRAAGS